MSQQTPQLLEKMPASVRPLLQNHLAFLQSHRGTLAEAAGVATLVSSKPEYTFAILQGPLPEQDWRNVQSRFATIYRTPWCDLSPEGLIQQGFSPQGALTYMVLEADLRVGAAIATDIVITRAVTTTDFETFSEVQCRGFLESPESYREWQPFLRDANLRNFDQASQHFFVAQRNGRCVGVTLVVIAGGVAGIYAVTTLPAERKTGVSTALLQHAVQEARRHGCRTVTLQVAHGSYAESLYLKLGFTVAFVAEIFKRS